MGFDTCAYSELYQHENNATAIAIFYSALPLWQKSDVESANVAPTIIAFPMYNDQQLGVDNLNDIKYMSRSEEKVLTSALLRSVKIVVK